MNLSVICFNSFVFLFVGPNYWGFFVKYITFKRELNISD